MGPYIFGSAPERPAMGLDPRRTGKPVPGMRMAFRASADAELAGIPAEVTEIWPSFRPGDYVVTLEYELPVWRENMLGRRIYAFLSELEALPPPARVRPA